MILQSLVRYYELLAADPESGIARPGWSSEKVSFAAVLSEAGDLANLVSLKIPQQRGKKTVEVSPLLSVPQPPKRTRNILPSFLCQNAGYMFGMASDSDPEHALKCHALFRSLHQELLDGVQAPEAAAILHFLEKWDPANAASHPLLTQYKKELDAGANLIFMLQGGRYAHEVPEIRKRWEQYRENQIEGAARAQCLVCGEQRPIARLHPSIKGVRNAQSSGASIVSFNENAFESYGKDGAKGLNAPVSEYAAFAYTTVLNHLLADSAHSLYLGDAAVVYWAQSTQPLYRDAFAALLDPTAAQAVGEKTRTDAAADRLIKSIFEKIAQGKRISAGIGLDPNTHFCVLALSPNAARLSVRFFLRDTFGSFVDRIEQHYLDMQLVHAPFEPDYFSVWKMLSETVSQYSKDKSAPPLLTGGVLQAILSGGAYPQALYNAMLLRIRAEHEVTYIKAAAIKACLIRKARTNPQISKEVFTVSLNEQSNDKAYVLGRLFSVLEKLQKDASPGINTTIRDRYFSSACAAPRTVFPALLRQSGHHISKSEYGDNSDRKIEELLNLLAMDGEPFPAHLSSDQQGIFILGYYHQKQANYTPKQK